MGLNGKIKNVAGYYAYDDNSVFVDKDGGTFAITLGRRPTTSRTLRRSPTERSSSASRATART